MKKHKTWHVKALISGFLILSSTMLFLQPVFAENNRQIKVELTEEEKDYVEKNPIVSVAFDDSWTPYSFYDEKEQKVKGIMPQLFNNIARKTGIQFKYVPHDTYADAIDSVQNGHEMCLSGLAENGEIAKNNHLNMTLPYMVINYSLVTQDILNELYLDEADYTLAVCMKSYSMQAMQKEMSKCRFLYFKNNQECLEAVKKGEVDGALLASYSSNLYLRERQFRDLNSILISHMTWGLTIGINQKVNPILLNILNKGIEAAIPAETNNAIYMGVTEANEYSRNVIDWIYDQPIIFSCICMVVMGLLFLSIQLTIAHKRKIRDIDAKVFKDDLTGTYNRRYLNEKIMRNNEHFGKELERMGIILIDLKSFKKANDTGGHLEGDQILKDVAQIFLNNTRITDKVIRYGGDEFLILMPSSTEEIIVQRIEELREQVQEVVKNHNNLFDGANFGYSYREHFLVTEDVMQQMFLEADTFMYKDKRKSD